ncbi:transcriptional repressor [Myxococcota bacterium]|nr:transcriptional repressor [Myxococcota bacterium]
MAPRPSKSTALREARQKLAAELRERGLRATGSRVAVLGVLRQQKRPMSHGEVADALSDEPWDKATIYRNLIDLCEAGLLHQAVLGGRVQRFETTDDAHAAAEHAHFVCVECGTISCVEGVTLKVEPSAKKLPDAVKSAKVELHLRGICDACE